METSAWIGGFGGPPCANEKRFCRESIREREVGILVEDAVK
jgi:hypothetical protein